MSPATIRLLFIINPGAGNNDTDWEEAIRAFFSSRKEYEIQLYPFPDPCDPEQICKVIREAKADRVIAVGGDGTLKLVAECVHGTDTPVGILPAGSANGMATELGIPADPEQALHTLIEGEIKPIHLTQVNGELCIHLADIGFNAFVIKKFDEENKRGQWGYVKAAWKVLWQTKYLEIKLTTDKEEVVRRAAMVVIANATQYGNGVVINPEGSLYDERFEVVVIRKISVTEIFKMRFIHKNFNPAKTEFFQAKAIEIRSRHKAHFQVDGEYRGKTNTVEAVIQPHALKMIVPRVNGQS
jgi:diacylglycerol kinase (ATP)